LPKKRKTRQCPLAERATEVCHTPLALPFTLKKDLKAKEELWKLKYFTMQKYNLQNPKPSKRNQNPSRYIIITL
jgi:hypothetical protein